MPRGSGGGNMFDKLGKGLAGGGGGLGLNVPISKPKGAKGKGKGKGKAKTPKPTAPMADFVKARNKQSKKY